MFFTFFTKICTLIFPQYFNHCVVQRLRLPTEPHLAFLGVSFEYTLERNFFSFLLSLRFFFFLFFFFLQGIPSLLGMIWQILFLELFCSNAWPFLWFPIVFQQQTAIVYPDTSIFKPSTWSCLDLELKRSISFHLRKPRVFGPLPLPD